MTKNYCVMRVISYQHSDSRYMNCLVMFDNDQIGNFCFFGTRLDWLKKLISIEETYPHTIFKTTYEEV